MITVASDAFTDTNGTELSAHDANWVKTSGYAQSLWTYSNRCSENGGTASASYYYAVAPSSADYSVSADIYRKTTGTTASLGINLRQVGTSFYHLRLNLLTGLELYKVISGAFTSLASDTGVAIPTVGNAANIRLEVSGTTFNAYYNDVLTSIAGVTDASLTATGYGGIRGYNPDSAEWDNFLVTEASPASAASSCITIDRRRRRS